MNVLDTNVLLYVHDPREPEKQAKAASLMRAQTDAALPWQVICEYLAASRKLEPFGYRLSDAFRDLRQLRYLWPILLPAWNVVDRAEILLARYSLSFWDALIVAQCLESGIDVLYSEDFDGTPVIEGLRIINPFKLQET